MALHSTLNAYFLQDPTDASVLPSINSLGPRNATDLDPLEIGHVKFKRTQLNTGLQDQLERSSSWQASKYIANGQLAMDSKQGPSSMGLFLKLRQSEVAALLPWRFLHWHLGSEPEGSGTAIVAPEGHGTAPSGHQRLLQTDSERLSL